MRAVVVGIESGSKFTDGEQRVMLKFADADSMWSEIRLPVSKLGLDRFPGAYLDQEFDLMIVAVPK